MGLKWEDITAELTTKGKNDLKVGQVLIFDFEGSKLYLKIMRKRHGKVWAKRVELHRPDEVETDDWDLMDKIDKLS